MLPAGHASRILIRTHLTLVVFVLLVVIVEFQGIVWFIARHHPARPLRLGTLSDFPVLSGI
jgi:hypothetical protein